MKMKSSPARVVYTAKGLRSSAEPLVLAARKACEFVYTQGDRFLLSYFRVDTLPMRCFAGSAMTGMVRKGVT